ncbi:MAG: outer membrane beta-barrel protein [Sulfurovaceae bacterium]|nr:outer membrane beta-barrel protein [Sulfurovaceae bacterium]
MKKTILTLLLATSLATAGTFAQIGAGYAKGDNDGDMATGFIGMDVISAIGLRLEYTKNFSEHSEFSKEDISRYGLFATYTLPLLSGLSVTPKAGLSKIDGEFKTKDTLETLSDSSTEFTYGLEINYKLNRAISMFIGYTDYGNELDIKDIDTSKMDTANYTFGIKIDI